MVWRRATQRTALAMPTPNRLAAPLRDMPSSTTALTTRSRRSSESAIPAASFAAETMNQNTSDSGIPLRFSLRGYRSKFQGKMNK